MPADLLHILRALIDAAFKTGGITDTAHADLHGRLNAAGQPSEPGPEAPAEPPAEIPAGAEGTGFDA